MMITDELIARFFHDQCTPAEARAVADHLHEHPEVLEAWLPEPEFLDLEAGELPSKVSSLWLRNIHRQVLPRQRLWIRRLAIAAVTAGVLAGSMYLLREKQAPAHDTAVTTGHQARGIAAEIHTNTSGQPMTLYLPDGSVVQLLPAASLAYQPGFANGRLVQLSGEADFTVVADKARPFVVHSSEIYTTVLGTFFHVKAKPEEEVITVALHSGKVLVQALQNEKKLMPDAVLLPGKALTYNRRTQKAFVFNIAASNEEGMVKAGSNGPAPTKPDWYQFNKQPMAQVLDQLSNYYGVNIYYYPSDIADIYFDGKFERTDSLAKILTDLTLPNNLKLVRKEDGFVIKRN